MYALGNHDPFAKASVIARGIVGVRGGVPFVASPAHRHAFDLRSGRCLDDDHVSIPAYDVRVVEGVVLIGHRQGSSVERAARLRDEVVTGVSRPTNWT